MKHGKMLYVLCLSILVSACGKTEYTSDENGSCQIDGCIYIDEGLIYRGKDIAEYYEYETGIYVPLCTKANCLHITNECMAVYLNKALSLGKLRDKWYYLMNDGWKYSFYCADLDGGNEKKIGTIDHGISGNDLYYKNSCIYESTRHVYDEETKDLKYFVSALYRYNFDERKEEILISETMNIGYELYGRYKNQLVYVEKDNQKRCYTVKLLDLETGEDKNLLKNTEDFYLGDLNEQYFVYMVKMEGNKGYKIIELNSFVDDDISGIYQRFANYITELQTNFEKLNASQRKEIELYNQELGVNEEKTKSNDKKFERKIPNETITTNGYINILLISILTIVVGITLGAIIFLKFYKF